MELQTFITTKIQPVLNRDEWIGDIDLRFNELLQDGFIIASALLNPKTALRKVKRKRNESPKIYYQPDLETGMKYFIMIYQSSLKYLE